MGAITSQEALIEFVSPEFCLLAAWQSVTLQHYRPMTPCQASCSPELLGAMRQDRIFLALKSPLMWDVVSVQAILDIICWAHMAPTPRASLQTWPKRLALRVFFES